MDVAPSRPRALIVNDDASQLRLISAVLQKAGLATHACTSAEQALADLSTPPPVDLIVTDLHMPGIDGWRFCRLLRSPAFRHCNTVPVLVVSATFSGRDAEQLTLDLGANGFLASPFAPSALQDYARALLSGRRPDPAPQVVIAHADAAEAQRLRAGFEAAGYLVDCAADAPTAIATWRALHPEVVIVDESLPDNGAAAVLAAAKGPRSRSVAFALSRDPGAAGGLALARSGADASVAAPADVPQLVELAASARRQRSLMRVEELLEERNQALRASEARWRSLFEAIPEIVILHDADGTIRHVNRSGAEQLEWRAEELVGRNLAEFACTALPLSAGRNPASGNETIWRSRTGRLIPVEISQRALSDDGRQAVLSVARDVSARHELARQRQTFLAMLTHDIKNPLAVVLGFTELLGEIGPLNAEQQDLLTRIQANAGTVLTLVANYLNLSQIESGQLVLHPRPVALAAVIDAVLQQYRAEATHEGLTLTAECAPDLGELAADPVALERVLTNLVHNAIKFTPSGGRIAIAALRSADAVTITVQDTGVGIAADELATIFQPYRRGTMRQPREGVGLGLYIAHSLVRAHGGTLTATSEPGHGTTFTITLPVQPKSVTGDQ